MAKRIVPTVIPRITCGRTVWQLIVDRCPHCGKRHVHGGGSIDGDLRHYDGHRVSDCQEGFGIGYFLRLERCNG